MNPVSTYQARSVLLAVCCLPLYDMSHREDSVLMIWRMANNGDFNIVFKLNALKQMDSLYLYFFTKQYWLLIEQCLIMFGLCL